MLQKKKRKKKPTYYHLWLIRDNYESIVAKKKTYESVWISLGIWHAQNQVLVLHSTKSPKLLKRTVKTLYKTTTLGETYVKIKNNKKKRKNIMIVCVKPEDNLTFFFMST